MEYYIAGCGGHAKVVYQIALENNIKIKSFLNVPLKNKSNLPKSILGIPIINYRNAKIKSTVFIGLGNNNDRIKTFKLLRKNKFKLPSLISKSSYVHNSVKIGFGSIIFPNVTINIDAEIKNNSIINSGSIIEHEVKINNNVNVAPGSIICGKTFINENCYIGAGSIIQQNLTIGKNCIIGSGSNVIDNIQTNSIAFGNPAKIK